MATWEWFAFTCLRSSLAMLCGICPASTRTVAFVCLSQLTFLSVFGNNLGGTLPASLGSLAELRTLLVHNNHFSGELPQIPSLVSGACACTLSGTCEDIPTQLNTCSVLALPGNAFKKSSNDSAVGGTEAWACMVVCVRCSLLRLVAMLRRVRPHVTSLVLRIYHC